MWSNERIIDMFNNFMKRIRNSLRSVLKKEEGQSAVLLVLSLTVILGCAALAVDLGGDYRASIRMQKAADLAALAAAMELPDSPAAMSVGQAVAAANGAPMEGISVNTPYNGDESLVEVICLQENSHGFARILGSDSATLKGRSVARMQPPKWMGAALPLLNVGGYDVGGNIQIWNKNSPGNFGVLYRKKMEWVEGSDGIPGHYVIECEDGVYVENGKIGQLKGNIQEMCAEGRTVFIFSLVDGTDVSSLKLGQGAHVEKDKLVLLQCTVSTYSFSSIALTVDAVYDIYGISGVSDIPDDYVFVADGYSSSLIE